MRRCPNGHPVFDDNRTVCACGAPVRPAHSSGETAPAPAGRVGAVRAPASRRGEPERAGPPAPTTSEDAEQTQPTTLPAAGPLRPNETGPSESRPNELGPLGARTEPDRTRALEAPEAQLEDVEPPEAVDARAVRREPRRPRRRLSRLGWSLIVLGVLALLAAAIFAGFHVGKGGSTGGTASPPAGSASTPSPAPAPATPGPNEPLLGQGSSGPDVARLQRALKAAGFNAGAADGVFGAGTAANLRAFQASKGLPATAKTDPLTWAALPRTS